MTTLPRSSLPVEHTVTCDVRYLAGKEPALAPAVAEELVGSAHRMAEAGIPRICDLLGIPARPVKVTLQDGPGVPRAKGENVLLPVPPGLGPEGIGRYLRCLSHELVHAVVGASPDPVLNEGLAVHVDAELRLAGSVWPFYELDPHRWVRLLHERGAGTTLSELLTQPWQCSTPAYLHAASYVRFLLIREGTTAFWPRYRRDAGQVSDLHLDEVETAWFESLGPPLTPAEHQLADRSLTELERDRRIGAATW